MHGGANPSEVGVAAFDGGGDDAGADRFGEDEAIARLRGAVGEDLLRMNRAGDGVTELHLVIANAVPADDGAAGLDHLGEAAGEHLFEHFGIALVGEADEGERADGPAAHGIDVAERVGGRDLAEDEWVVDDGSEEVDGLHDGELGCELIHAGVVGGIEADQDVGVMLPG